MYSYTYIKHNTYIILFPTKSASWKQWCDQRVKRMAVGLCVTQNTLVSGPTDISYVIFLCTHPSYIWTIINFVVPRVCLQFIHNEEYSAHWSNNCTRVNSTITISFRNRFPIVTGVFISLVWIVVCTKLFSPWVILYQYYIMKRVLVTISSNQF